MKFHGWANYGDYGETVEITVRDGSGAKLESWKLSAQDKKTLKKVYGSVKRKYGIDLFMKFTERNKDLEWLR